ncbi:hypothetical protein ACLOJK_023724 [Asimina triloba]
MDYLVLNEETVQGIVVTVDEGGEVVLCWDSGGDSALVESMGGGYGCRAMDAESGSRSSISCFLVFKSPGMASR